MPYHAFSVLNLTNRGHLGFDQDDKTEGYAEFRL